MIEPHLHYCNITWGLSNNKGIQNLIKSQKKAIRSVACAKYNSHADPLFGKYNLMKFDDLVSLNICKFMAKFMLKKLPSTFDTVFKELNSARCNKLLIEIPKMKFLENFPAVAYPKLWNSQSNDIRSSKSVTEVAKKIKKIKSETYKNFRCLKNKCFPCKK